MMRRTEVFQLGFHLLRSWVRVPLLAAVVLSVAACGRGESNAETPLGTESHFLIDCETDATCGDRLRCLAGRCSVECTSEADCTSLVEQGTCAQAASTRSCDVECDSNDDCDALAANECTNGLCRQPSGGETNAPVDDPGSPAPGTSDTPGTPAAPAPANPTGDDGPAAGAAEAGAPSVEPSAQEPFSPRPSVDSPDAGTDPDGGTSPVCTQPASAYEVLGECTVDLDCPMFVDDCGCGCLPEVVTDPLDAGAPAADPSAPPTGDATERQCSVSADCVLATRIDTCCPGCPEAFSSDFVAAQECAYAEAEVPPTGCAPDECPDGCPGAACVDVLAALCVGGQCTVAVATSSCAPDTCDVGEYCVWYRDGYQCQPEGCTYDTCHPERCDNIGEACCDPFPGDGPNYCNAGLTCGTNGCEAPAEVDPNRVCSTILCPDGEVCCDKCTGACVNALSGAQCPSDDTSEVECSTTFPCGPDVECSKVAEYCRSFMGGPVSEPDYSCAELPEACGNDLACPCLETATFGACTVTPEGGFLVEESAP